MTQTDSNYKISFSSRESTKQSKFLNNMLRGTTIILLDERRRLRKQHWLVVAAAAAFIVVLAVLAQPVTALDYTGEQSFDTRHTLTTSQLTHNTLPPPSCRQWRFRHTR